MSVTEHTARAVAASGLAGGDVGATTTALTGALDQLQTSIERHLRRAGIALPDAKLADMSDAILTDAVRVALLWLGEHDG